MRRCPIIPTAQSECVFAPPGILLPAQVLGSDQAQRASERHPPRDNKVVCVSCCIRPELPRVAGYWKLVGAGLRGAELNRAMFELLLGRALQVA
jgi:hypothetical protein